MYFSKKKIKNLKKIKQRGKSERLLGGNNLYLAFP
jgi:hypothetical protein